MRRPPTSEATSTSTVLLVADEALFAHASLYPGRIVVPRAWHEDMLAWPTGRLVVGERTRDRRRLGGSKKKALKSSRRAPFGISR